jgi:hypothetical protein
MRKTIQMRDLPKAKQIKLLLILDANRVKEPTKAATTPVKRKLTKNTFGVNDYLNFINDKLKR